MQLTRALKKDIASLASAKGRRRCGNLFMAEGTKCVLDTLGHFELRYLIATPDWLAEHNMGDNALAIAANRGEIGEMSSMTLAPDVIAVYAQPEAPVYDPAALRGRLTVALDRLQDPGNLGTIMRTCDWMGITTILASADTADCYNPKTVQATMGAISRVKVVYGDLEAMLAQARMDVYGTFLDGDNIYTADLGSEGIIVMGNEGNGISDGISKLATRRLLIPSYPPGAATGESLNVATATAITLSQFIARKYGQD